MHLSLRPLKLGVADFAKKSSLPTPDSGFLDVGRGVPSESPFGIGGTEL